MTSEGTPRGYAGLLAATLLVGVLLPLAPGLAAADEGAPEVDGSIESSGPHCVTSTPTGWQYTSRYDAQEASGAQGEKPSADASGLEEPSSSGTGEGEASEDVGATDGNGTFAPGGNETSSHDPSGGNATAEASPDGPDAGDSSGSQGEPAGNQTHAGDAAEPGPQDASGNATHASHGTGEAWAGDAGPAGDEACFESERAARLWVAAHRLFDLLQDGATAWLVQQASGSSGMQGRENPDPCALFYETWNKIFPEPPPDLAIPQECPVGLTECEGEGEVGFQEVGCVGITSLTICELRDDEVGIQEVTGCHPIPDPPELCQPPEIGIGGVVCFLPPPMPEPCDWPEIGVKGVFCVDPWDLVPTLCDPPKVGVQEVGCVGLPELCDPPFVGLKGVFCVNPLALVPTVCDPPKVGVQEVACVDPPMPCPLPYVGFQGVICVNPLGLVPTPCQLPEVGVEEVACVVVPPIPEPCDLPYVGVQGVVCVNPLALVPTPCPLPSVGVEEVVCVSPPPPPVPCPLPSVGINGICFSAPSPTTPEYCRFPELGLKDVGCLVIPEFYGVPGLVGSPVNPDMFEYDCSGVDFTRIADLGSTDFVLVPDPAIGNPVAHFSFLQDASYILWDLNDYFCLLPENWTEQEASASVPEWILDSDFLEDYTDFLMDPTRDDPPGDYLGLVLPGAVPTSQYDPLGDFEERLFPLLDLVDPSSLALSTSNDCFASGWIPGCGGGPRVASFNYININVVVPVGSQNNVMTPKDGCNRKSVVQAAEALMEVSVTFGEPKIFFYVNCILTKKWDTNVAAGKYNACLLGPDSDLPMDEYGITTDVFRLNHRLSLFAKSHGIIDEDKPWNIALGIVRHGNHNGVACGFSAILAEKASMKADWPHRTIALHEISHLFDALHHPTETVNWGKLTQCSGSHEGTNYRYDSVMNFCWAWKGYMWFDNINFNIVYYNLRDDTPP